MKKILKIADSALSKLKEKQGSDNTINEKITDKSIDDLYLSIVKSSAYLYYHVNTQGNIPIKEFYYDELKNGLDI